MHRIIRLRLFAAAAMALALLPAASALHASGPAEAESETQRMERINREIVERNEQWIAGPTWPGSLPGHKRELLLGFIPPPPGMLEGIPTLELETSASLPAVFDWRALGGTTAAKNQGACGSCWAFAPVGQLESHARIYDGRILDLSEQAIIDCNTYGAGCNGGWAAAAYEIFRNYGAVAETCVPYLASHGHPCTQTACEVLARISSPGYASVPNSVSQIKQTVYDTGPVSTSMYVHDNFYNYTSGCWNVHYPGTSNHAVLIVGWDDNACGGEGAWIVKNSWGRNWGIDGYFYIKYGVCNIGSYTYQIDYIPSAVYVEVLSPNGGEVFEVDTVREIAWRTAREAPDSIAIYASLNSGLDYDSLIVSGLPGAATSYQWTVPRWPVRTARIKAVAWLGGEIAGYDFSNADFRIKGDPHLYVSPAGANIYPYTIPEWAATSIQAAVDAAFAGDTIMVAAATYPERITIARSLHLRGGWDAGFSARDPRAHVTTINAGGSTVSFMNVSGSCGIDGFTIRGGTGTSASLPYNGIYGGGIFCYNSSPVISNNVITACGYTGAAQFSGGGGVAVYGGTAVIESNTIDGCLAQSGGGVYLYQTSAELRGNRISGAAPHPEYGGTRSGGGIFALHSSVEMSGNTVEDCTGYTNGGGIYARQSPVTLAGDSIRANSCTTNGGGICMDRSALVASRVTLLGNAAGSTGGGLYLRAAAIELENAVVAVNRAGLGGGVYADSAWGGIDQNTFDRNTALYGGGNLLLGQMEPLSVDNNIITCGSPYGLLTSSLANVSLRYNNFYGNTPSDCHSVTPDATNISRDPCYADTSALDYRLGLHSGSIDAGDPHGGKDPDGSRADQGAFGGPGADFAAPSRMAALSATAEGEEAIRLSWAPSPSPGVVACAVYAGEEADFAPGLETFLALVDVPDTVFVHAPVTGCLHYRVSPLSAAGYAGGFPPAAVECAGGDTLAPVVEVLFPNGSERLYSGETVEIAWIATDNARVDSVSIWLTLDGGATYELLFGGLPNDPPCEWLVPVADSDSCLIRVVAYDPVPVTGEDTSDGFFSIKDPTGVGEGEEEEEPGTPRYVTALGQNVPNPFNGTTTIAYTIGEACAVDLGVYDGAGRLVRMLARGSRRAAGGYTAVWDGRDNAGRQVASGVYFARLRAGKYSQTRKMVYLR